MSKILMSGGGGVKPIPASNTSIQESTWSGSLPILLSLSSTSLSSPSPPRPIHKMISRVAYLHLALHEEVMQLSCYAPAAAFSSFAGMSVEEPPDDSPTADNSDGGNVDNNNNGDGSEKETSSPSLQQNETTNNKRRDTYPECWFEDEESGMPLRWNLFVGVLYDLMKGKSMLKSCSSWKNVSNECTQHNFLPWRIRVHFTSYPTDYLLPLNNGCNNVISQSDNDSDVGSHDHITTLLRSIYRNSLKQALFMQYNSSKVAMSITKHSHHKIWDAVLQSNYSLYHEVNKELQAGISSPAISSTAIDAMLDNEDGSGDDNIPQLIPVRVMLNGMRPMQRPIKHRKENIEDISCKRPTEILEKLGTSQAPPYTTLGDVLAKCLPAHFEIDPSSRWTTVTSDSNLYYSVQGIQPSLKCTLVDLWRALSHPDHFLYIIVITE